MSRFTPNYYQACRIQDKILNMIGIVPQNKSRHDPESKKELKPAELASLAKAFDIMEERKRILRDKPLVKAVDAPTKSKSHKPMTFSE